MISVQVSDLMKIVMNTNRLSDLGNFQLAGPVASAQDVRQDTDSPLLLTSGDSTD